MVAGMISLGELVSQWGGNMPLGSFERNARYYEAMDVILYLEDDVPYRADRVDAFMTLLWHPSEERAIGVKLKGCRYLFQRLQSHVESLGMKLPDDTFVPLIAALEVAMTAGLGEELLADTERQRIAAKYQTARQVIAGVTMNRSAIGLAA